MKDLLTKQGKGKSKMRRTSFKRDPVNSLKINHKEFLMWSSNKTWSNWYVILMRAAVIKVITTVCLIVNILVTNVESASLNIHLSVNPQKIVARWLTGGFNVVCPLCGCILYVCHKMLILSMTSVVRTVVRVSMMQSWKFKNCRFSVPFVIYLQLSVNDLLPVILLVW